MFYTVITQNTQDVDTLFGSENINEGVSLLGKGVGVAVVSKDPVKWVWVFQIIYTPAFYSNCWRRESYVSKYITSEFVLIYMYLQNIHQNSIARHM